MGDKGVTIKMRTWVLLLAIVLLAGFATYKIVQYKKDVASLEQVLAEKNSAIKTFTEVMADQRYTIYQNKLLIVESQKALKKSEQYAEELKKLNIRHVHAIGDLELKISAMEDSLQVYKSKVPPVITDTPIDVVEINDKPMIELPASFGWQDEWATSWGVITEDGNGESGFEINDLPLNIILGSKGFFKKTQIASVSTPNPYVKVDAQQFVVADYTKKITPILVSAGTGVIIGTVLCLLLTR